MTFKGFLKRLQNTGTIISVVSGVVLICTACGLKIDNNTVTTVVNAVCSIGVALGIFNNPETSGIDLPKNNTQK